MKFRLFPSDMRGLGLLRDLASEVNLCVGVLSEMLGSSEDRAVQLDALDASEARATDLHYAVLTHLRTSYVNPLPREDVYTFSRLLHEAVEQLSGGGILIAHLGKRHLSHRAAEQLELIGRQTELTTEALGKLQRLDDLEDVWLDLVRISKRAHRTHQTWLGEIGELNKAGTIIRHRSVADQLHSCSQSLRAVADHLGRVLVKES
ncbi:MULTISPECIES: hypothetical protein [Paeniglutamicibacter]|uniref:Nuclease PIN n=1 Tax=Paeniglutamicibacter sulfureus TaxID=43666 RepID=A0ABU2BI57_9MICC|nr:MULTISPECIES: hypothetical protein [Paeniglutamicibacter]MCV9995202.1 hypothetical protein [Paeniglutamicibacter sp. ZC-3]MDO2933874.1 hypothetical protein [Paeniglutamicibacter sulfureus]MDR7358315.1 hypothetical protein [Paeniglutamicibacter sulfureus]